MSTTSLEEARMGAIRVKLHEVTERFDVPQFGFEVRHEGRLAARDANGVENVLSLAFL
jgi:hypothetical protein